MGEKISISNEIFQGLKAFENKVVPLGGTPADKIRYLLGVPLELQKTEKQLSGANAKIAELNERLHESTARIDELKEANQNILDDKIDANKKMDIELKRELAGKNENLKRFEIQSKKEISNATNLTTIAVQAMKQKHVTKEDMQPLIKKIIPRIEGLLDKGDALIADSEKVIEASVEQKSISPTVSEKGD